MARCDASLKVTPIFEPIKICQGSYVNNLVQNGGVSMKGKRKAKTAKWLFAEQCRIEACVLLSRRSAKASRFLDVALSIGRDAEPCGRLAGSSRYLKLFFSDAASG